MWQDGYTRLFMTHVSSHKEFVGEVKTELADYGIDGFVAHEDIDPSKEWLEEIEEALQSCQALAVFLHDGFRESDWADQEVGYCLATHTKTIPLRFHMNPYGFISRYQAANCSHSSPTEVAATVFSALLADMKLQSENALVTAFANSKLYTEAVRRSKRLVTIDSWSWPQLKEIEAAVRDNPQCAGAYFVPERIQEIIDTKGPDAAPF